MGKLKEEYEEICERYCALFSMKQQLSFYGWVGKDVGGVTLFSDYYIGFENIRYDIDNQIEKGKILTWYDYSMVEKQISLNYENWLKSNLSKTTP